MLRTIEQRMKISEGTKKAMKRPEVIVKISKTWFKKGVQSNLFSPFKKGHKIRLGIHHTEASNEKNRLSQVARNYHHSFEIKELIRKSSEQRWKNEEYKNRVFKKIFKSLKMSPNKQEKNLNSLLNLILPSEYKYVGDGQFVLGGRCPDFINVNGQKKLIELYGDYWHRGQNPCKRINYFKQFGFDCLVVWEKELKNLELLKQKIIDFNVKVEDL